MKLALFLLAATMTAAEWVPREVEATAYCPCKICCGVRAKGITADGTDTRKVPYGVASDPTHLPYGSRVWIPLGCGYLDASRSEDEQRQFSVDDTGGGLVSEGRRNGTVRIDLRFRTHWWAKRFGRKTITIYRWVE